MFLYLINFFINFFIVLVRLIANCTLLLRSIVRNKFVLFLKFTKNNKTFIIFNCLLFNVNYAIKSKKT